MKNAPTIHSQSVLDHQRPDGVLGEWNLIPEEAWNTHQKVADTTRGFASLANATSAIGGETTRQGTHDFARGDHFKGIVKIGIGRTLDVVDGFVAKRFGTRSKTGAAVDAGIDKALVVDAAVTLTRAGVLPKYFAGATAVQQSRIMAENAKIKKAGGEPNPSKDGKHSMAAIWVAIGLRGMETTFKTNSHKKAARIAGVAALAAEAASLGLSEAAIHGYRKQHRELITKD